MLLSVSISSFVFLFPNRALNLYNGTVDFKGLDRRSIDIRDLVSAATTFLVYCNYGINLFAYTLLVQMCIQRREKGKRLIFFAFALVVYLGEHIYPSIMELEDDDIFQA